MRRDAGLSYSFEFAVRVMHTCYVCECTCTDCKATCYAILHDRDAGACKKLFNFSVEHTGNFLQFYTRIFHILFVAIKSPLLFVTCKNQFHNIDQILFHR